MRLPEILMITYAVLNAPVAASAEKHADHWRGTAAFGVDVLGRWVIALDSHPEDGIIDRYWRYTASEYLPGPWFETATVHILYRSEGQLALRTGDGSRLVVLDVSDGSTERKPHSWSRNIPHGAELEVHTDGLELASLSGVRTRLDSFDAFDLSAWPPGFDDDLLNPGTGGVCGGQDFECETGGPGDPSCEIDGCDIQPTSCAVTCNHQCWSCCACVPQSQILFNPTISLCKCFSGQVN